MSEHADRDLADLPVRFTYHPPNDTRRGGLSQHDRYVTLRDRAASMAREIVNYCPPSRERSLALTKLEEAVMWSNAAIARREA